MSVFVVEITVTLPPAPETTTPIPGILHFVFSSLLIDILLL